MGRSLTDPKQALRFRRTLLGLGSYFVAFGVVACAFLLGYLQASGIEFLVAVLCALVVNGGFILLILTGLNRRLFRDPSMTFLQVLLAMLWMVWAVWAAPEISGMMSLLLIPPFMFGIFRLQTREQLGLAAIVSVVYGAVIYAHASPNAGEGIPLVGVLQWLVVSATLFWFSFISGYVYSLRLSLRSHANELEEARDEMRLLAIRDPLTGLYNRRHIMEVLEHEQSRAERTGSVLSLALLDLDGFKAINDRHGHLEGDRVLREVADRLRETTRLMDWAGRNAGQFARFGGEEFLVVLPETGPEDAWRCAERIRKQIVSKGFAIDGHFVDITLSGGVATLREGDAIDGALQRADEHLYRAKSRGRNRIAGEGEPVGTAPNGR